MLKKICLIGFVSILTTQVQAKSLRMSFIAKTNIPGMTIEGETEKPVALKSSQSSIAFGSLKTGMESRDEHMYDDIFKKKDINFQVFNFETCLAQKKCDAEIQINLAGKSKNIKLPIEIVSGAIETKFSIKLTDFEITPPEKFGVKVEDQVEVSVHVSGL